MYLLKKVVLGLGLLTLIYGGSAGTQSSSLFVQGMSFIGLLVIAIILFVFSKMLLRGLGCMPSLLIMLGVGVFMMYTLGMFNNGIMGTFDAISRFVGRDTQTQETAETNEEELAPISAENQQPMAEEHPNPASNGALFDDVRAKKQEAPTENKPKQGLLGNVLSALSGQKPQQEQKAFNPTDYPVIYVVPRVLTGDTFEVHGRYFKLFGIAAPENNQTCSNAQGRSYNCGREAALWLKDWLEDNEVECHVIQQDTAGNMVGTCSYGPYDIGAAIVNAGWAVAYTKYTDAYMPYEIQAQQNRRGLWQGEFYKPWDWRKIQQRKATVKIIRPKKKRKGIFG